jgi:hypothetical protein
LWGFHGEDFLEVAGWIRYGGSSCHLLPPREDSESLFGRAVAWEGVLDCPGTLDAFDENGRGDLEDLAEV